MKATSIEQIREHLARGGRVVSDKGESVGEVVEHLAVNMGGIILPFQFTERDWQLLPLEEPEEFCDKCKFLSASDDFCQPCWKLFKKLRNKEWAKEWLPFEPVDHGTQKGPASVRRIEASRKQIEQQLACQHCNGKGGHWDDESIDQWHWCEHCDAAEKHFAPLRAEKNAKDERMQRIRTRLLHGQWPEMTDLLAWWEATTGERIETGKRCEKCNGTGIDEGAVPDWYVAKYGPIKCANCQGTGYSVRPTWMGSEKE